MATPSPKGIRPPSERDETSPAKPVATFRYGSVSAAVFTNTVSKGGKTFDVHAVSVRRSYRNAQGEWEQTHSLRAADLLPTALALQKCYEFINDAPGVSDEEQP